MDNINKENFFNGMMEKYPAATQQFCDWIDNYKKEVGMVDWRKPTETKFIDSPNLKVTSVDGKVISRIKFHNLPFEMQKGIIHRFMKEVTKQDMINFTMEGLMKDFEKILDHLQDKVNYKAL